MTYHCDYCTARLPTQQGLRSHIGQSAACAQKRHDRYTAESSAEESDSDSLSVEGLGVSRREVPAGYTEAGEFEEDSLDEDMSVDPPIPSQSNDAQPKIDAPAEIPARSKRPRATVEEVEDKDDGWTQDFPEDQRAGAILEECCTQFEKIREGQKDAKQEPWYPFESQDEWELAQWLMTSGLSQAKREEYLKLKAVREGINPLFHNKRAFLNRIDNLPKGAQWYCHPFKMKGDNCDEDGEPIVEVVEL
ncbi:hypothetical protein C8R43DRAFT_1120723 [Mycena crocata]|nr:hypothetical protein C8R43DRAFT_1120723 [Mycena crocata]